MWETWVQSLVQEDPLEESVATHSNIRGQRILAGYSPWGHKESNLSAEELMLLNCGVGEDS